MSSTFTVVTALVFFPFVDDLITGNDHFIYLCSFFMQGHIDFLLSGVGYFLRFHADKGETQKDILCVGQGNGVFSVGVCNDSHLGAFDHYCHTR